MPKVGRKPKGLPKTKNIGGKKHTKVSCSKTKTAAKSAAAKLRAKGKRVRTVKNPLGGYCNYAR